MRSSLDHYCIHDGGNEVRWREKNSDGCPFPEMGMPPATERPTRHTRCPKTTFIAHAGMEKINPFWTSTVLVLVLVDTADLAYMTT